MEIQNTNFKKNEYKSIDESQFWDDHRKLAAYNKTRLAPGEPDDGFVDRLQTENLFRILENKVLLRERATISDLAAAAPKAKFEFLEWFEELKSHGPGQNTHLFDWLANEANAEQMKWFIAQEVAGEAGFEDLTALTQIKMPVRPKLEMARNYWDEMGRGREPGMHGPMLDRVAEEFDLAQSSPYEVVPEAIALGNVMMAMALDRRYAFHSAGALGAIELTAPGRAKKVYEGLKRLGVSREAQRYYLLHSSLDIQHSIDWNREVIAPLLEEYPDCARSLAEGALIRLNAGARCFARYEKHFRLTSPDNEDGTILH